jgi:hypothetical protein
MGNLVYIEVSMNDKRNQYWGALISMRKEYENEVGNNTGMTGPTMQYWAEGRYGFKIGTDGSGNYTQYYDIVDPKKFLLFQIKYMK